MPAPNSEEFLREQSACQLVASFYGYEIAKTQQAGKDDFGADAILTDPLYITTDIRLEYRSKGFENHQGVICQALWRGWNSPCLKDGITINRRSAKEPFWFAVKFPRWRLRLAKVTSRERLEFLAAQSHRTEVSTNSKTPQAICRVPLSWFEIIS